jgi:hypothetical protein
MILFSIMSKKTMSTYDKFIASLSNAEHKEFNEGYQQFLLSELIFAAKAKDNVAVRKLEQELGKVSKK